ncbi:SGNH/GDSL hydrolase family protein [Leptolyngbya sp. FACHB-36]|uniref:SGNH/GDSL hydrolase family protein n=1 Tax=Leptolyngbya sp. FACHB-36 TaxID=2692808 RepID=UPI00168081D7|nr:SGNH/GDSL hydrolase family protein [Leptolyngbya sp. FACHB-36]MBD2021482.1 SGNH/GDSL hydrolase family protein [Leptolyngbya sp. FACHB-36]
MSYLDSTAPSTAQAILNPDLPANALSTLNSLSSLDDGLGYQRRSSTSTASDPTINAAVATAAELPAEPSSPFSQLIVFGDSLSDPGNLFTLSAGLAPDSPSYFKGRFSNGPIWVDYFAPEQGFSENSVINLAFGGAQTGRDNTGNPVFGLNLLPGVLNQIDAFAFLSRLFGGADSDALYVVWAGGNDLLDLTPDPLAIGETINDAVTNIVTAITKLADLGAEQILVPNAFDFGLTPLSIRNGASSITTGASIAFNQALDQALEPLEQNLGINLIEVDLFSISQRIAAVPEEFGFTNLTDPLIDQANPVNPDEFFWWDEIHPTTRVHELVSSVFAVSIADQLPSVANTAVNNSASFSFTSALLA